MFTAYKACVSAVSVREVKRAERLRQAISDPHTPPERVEAMRAQLAVRR
jgi:hypothetical protein